MYVLVHTGLISKGIKFSIFMSSSLLIMKHLTYFEIRKKFSRKECKEDAQDAKRKRVIG